MTKIPFSIDKRPEIEAGKLRVMTGDGYPARIVCWDFKGDSPLLVAVMEDGIELTRTYEENGFYVKGGTTLDLFLVPAEPELTEFEEAVRSCVVETLTETIESPTGAKMSSSVYIDVDKSKKMAAELLSLARKELQPEIDAEVEKAYKNADRMQYEKGKEDALKDCPTWKKCEDGNTDRLELEALCREAGSPIEIAFRANGYRIFLSDLEKLPKEE